jgi:hypothetical protein
LGFTLKEKESESNIDATVRLEGGSIILKPTKALEPSTEYIATVSKDVRDIEGNAIDLMSLGRSQQVPLDVDLTKGMDPGRVYGSLQ